MLHLLILKFVLLGREKEMKCFHYFKDKSNRGQRSEPILKNTSSLNNSSSVSAAERVIKSSGSTSSPRGIPEMYEEKAVNLRVFTYSELKQATNDFSRLLKIGEGGFGSVYKGTIKPVAGKGEGIEVAIKQLNRDGFQVNLWPLEKFRYSRTRVFICT